MMFDGDTYRIYGINANFMKQIDDKLTGVDICMEQISVKMLMPDFNEEAFVKDGWQEVTLYLKSKTNE